MAAVPYVTDRAQTGNASGETSYGYGRSYSLCYGSATVRMGEKNITRDQLAAAPRTCQRKGNLHVSVADTKEKGRFPETPYPLVKGKAWLMVVCSTIPH